MQTASPGHTRSSSFLSVFKNKQSDSSRHYRTLSQPPMPSPALAVQPSAPHQPQSQSLPLTQPLHPEIRSVVQLNHAHAHKVYFSGPLIRKLEFNPDGQKPIKDEGWSEIWAQLGGTTLSVWDMKEIEVARKEGREVPPSYLNVTDANIQVLGSVTDPATPTTPSKRFQNVLTLNTAGANLYLFSCQSIPALRSWAAALRLTAWERSRLDEIYTAHLIRITLTARDLPTTLIKGKMEGWARVRMAGQTDWKKVWLVVTEASGDRASDQHSRPAANGHAAALPPTIKKKRVSSIFASSSPENAASNPTLPSGPLISIYASPKPKDKKAPLLTISNVSQAFAVFPERPEMISKSTLMKVEGLFDESDIGTSWKGREGWVFIMPESENAKKQPQAGVQGGGQVVEMLKWIVALHDAFKLYGRPEAWTWDPRDPVSMMYGYPVGPTKETLFLDREVAEAMDPREDRTSFYRVDLKKLLQQHMRPPVQIVNPQNRAASGQSLPGIPPPPGAGLDGANPNPTGVNNGALPPLPQLSGSSPPGVGGPQLPPLSFGSGGAVPFPTGPNPNNTPANNNNVPSSRLSTIEESSVVTHGNQHQQNSELQGGPGATSPGPGPSSTFAPLPTMQEDSGGPAVPAKPPSPTSGPSPRQPVHLSTVLSQSQPQVPQESPPSVIPPRFQNQGQGGFGSATPGSRTSPSPRPGPALINYGSSQSSRVDSPATAAPPVTNLPNEQQLGSRPLIGPLGSFGSQPPSFGTTSVPANVSTTTIPSQTPFSRVPVGQPLRPQLSTSTSAATTLSMSSTTMTTATSASGGLNTEESNDLLKEPGVMFILGGGVQPPQPRKPDFIPGYGAGMGAGLGAGFGSGMGPGVGAGVGAGIGAGLGAGVGTGLGSWNVGTGVGSQPVSSFAKIENDNGDDGPYGSNAGSAQRDGETAFLQSSIAAPTPHTPRNVGAYSGMAESEEGHQPQEQQYTPGPPVRKGAPMSFAGADSPLASMASPKSENTSPLMVTKLAGPAAIPDRLSPTRFGSALGRKPSGARELVAPRHGSTLGSSSPSRSGTNSIAVGSDDISTSSRTFTEDGSVMEATVGQSNKVMVGAVTPSQIERTSSGQDDEGVGEEALATLTYLNFADDGEHVGQGSITTSTDPATTTTATPSTVQVPPPSEVYPVSIEPLQSRHTIVTEPSSSGPGGLSDANDMLPYTESSFAPSNKAAERKAKAKAQKDAHLAAVHKPGRANGKKKSMAGAWDSSEDEEEEEDEEDDEDVDSDGERRRHGEYKGKGSHHLQSGPSGSASSSALGHGRLVSQVQSVAGGIGGDPSEVLTPSQFRPSRHLPQIPLGQSPGEEHTLSRRIPSDQYMDGARRTYYEEGPQIRTQADAPLPGSQRQTIWTKVLDPGQQGGRPQSEHAKETFVQLEPSETMTKAFALHGLLSVGMQDKEDRSARRQEELARETGASLINVPNKPPPPQSGLLGYVTAHERERKREGGLGATLTEREREKRVAEERQRRLDDQQRQQLDQMQQGMMFNPMMNPMNPMMNMMMNMNPMMTGGGMGGMNPMMTGGGMGMNPMNPMMSGFGGMGGGGYGPQHMFAAQQAAQAYQQAMVAFSVAGSQGGPTAGGGGGNGAEGGTLIAQRGHNTGMSPGMGGVMNPAMTGGYDPRMSMFGMNNMMGMGMGMPPMGMGGGLGPQMTGMSNFDAMTGPGPGFAGGVGGMGVGSGMNTSPNANELGGVGGPGGFGGLQPPVRPVSQFSSRTSSPAGRGSPKVLSPNSEYQQRERGRPSRPATPK